ncbi:tRNA adenylyltransferase [Aspergillus foveolatus]|uniref:tRNA adenylyltransferase n=1 Tax=Aspergillus foveolatus TaxID=210207 RepID=UPI003CCDEBAD
MNPAADGTSQQLPTIQLTPPENTLKDLLLDVAQYIQDCDTANAHGDGTKTVLRFTGGWVRDKLLGVESHDIDVAINNMTGYQFGTMLKEYLDIPENLDKYKGQNGEKELSLHKIEANPEKSKHLETVTTKIFGFDVDLVNLRKEAYDENSRTPQMEFGTAEEDALRRDATINALFYNLNESKVEDLTGRGLDDMRDEIIRTPMEPYQTFKDDPLRVLRLIRFASRLGFRIDKDTENAMQHGDIGAALKLKISRERVGIEVQKMLQGPDPRGALHIIDRLNLYPIIFANFQDDATADYSTWSLAYDALHRLCSEDDSGTVSRVRGLLVRDSLETYYSWVIVAFAPWSAVPTRVQGTKLVPPRMAETARDSLRADNRTVNILKQTGTHWRNIIDVKTALVEGRMEGTAAEIRQQLGLHIRSWSTDWRFCILLSLLQEIMQGGDFVKAFAAVVQSYDQFLSYIVEQDLQDVCDLKHIVKGDEIMEAFGTKKKGPWVSNALKLVIEWQLLHPGVEDKEGVLNLRNAANAALQQPALALIPDLILADLTPITVSQLWQEISTYSSSDNSKILQNLLIAEASLRNQSPENLSDVDKSAINRFYTWATQDESRQRSTLAVSVISRLNALLPFEQSECVSSVVIALASFSSDADAWNTHEAFTASTIMLRVFVEASSFWLTIESILKSRVRPIFAKAKNPAITESGRKNFHPIPLPRFDSSILDPETKPWKLQDAYITTVFAWIVNQYKAADINTLEAHFPLLVPPILALIDDSSHFYKRLGCILLSEFLVPIRESKSDILRRTNLSSVFEDAIRPLFHSLPTITPEDDSIQLLSGAYPALRSLVQTSYRLSPATNRDTSSARQLTDEEKFISTTTKTLRDHLIPSFHHISSTNPTTSSGSTFASFPHPRLSTFLLDQVAITCADIGIHTTKYLQEIIPLIYSTLSNPFGTAHPPLLLSALSATRAVILNAYPRLWRWRGEMLGAICSCWIHIFEEEGESKRVDGKKADELGKLKKQLQGAVYLLRYALEHPVHVNTDQGQREAKENIGKEIQILVEADETLEACLLAEINSDDPTYFGYNTCS